MGTFEITASFVAFAAIVISWFVLPDSPKPAVVAVVEELPAAA